MLTLISIQMNTKADLQANLSKVDSLVEKACSEAELLAENKSELVKLVVLPECFSVFGVGGAAMLAHAEHLGKGVVQETLSDIAKRYKCFLVAGTTPIIDAADLVQNNKYYATSLVYNPLGVRIAHYNKIHLFDVEVSDATKSYKESLFTQAGDGLSLFDIGLAQVAQSVCYDLRFVQMFSAYSTLTSNKQAPDIIVVPSAFTYTTGQAHWHALLKARSIENQCYVVAANQVGVHADKRQTFGNSCIYSPWGECLSKIENQEGFAICDFDRVKMETIRQKMPISQHKKELYTAR